MRRSGEDLSKPKAGTGFHSRPHMASLHIVSPSIKSEALSSLTGVEVYLKLDNLQPSGSFKIRGLGNHVQQAITQRQSSSIVSSSGGNAGMTVAYIGHTLGIPTTIVLPVTTPNFVIKRLGAYGATVKLFGAYWDEAHAEALRLLETIPGACLVHPFDHPEIWEGHKTVIPELVHQIPSEPSAILCSVGGGGLFTGLYKGLQESVWPRTELVTAETEGAESFGQAVKQGEWVKLEKIDSIAKTLGALQVTEEAFKLATSSSRGVQPFAVTDAEVVATIGQFLDDHRILVEPACAAALALLYTQRHREKLLANLDRSKPLVVFVCGGNMITHDLLLEYQQMFK